MAKNVENSNDLTLDKIMELDGYLKSKAVPPSECPYCGWKYYLFGGTVEQQVEMKCEQCWKYLFPEDVRRNPNPRCPVKKVFPNIPKKIFKWFASFLFCFGMTFPVKTNISFWVHIHIIYSIIFFANFALYPIGMTTNFKCSFSCVYYFMIPWALTNY